MKITVFGLGHVGLVTALYIAKSGHTVEGVEVSIEKVEQLKNKKLYIKENDLQDVFETVCQKNFSVTNHVSSLGEIVFICVGTPPRIDGTVDLKQVLKTTESIARLLQDSPMVHQLVFRSTFPPGTIEDIIIPLLKNSCSKKINKDYFIYYFPEFLREGDAWEDINNPSLNVWGSTDKETIPFFSKDLGFDKKELSLVSYKSGEMIKYMNNSFHALKITFSNEMANISQAHGVDIAELFELFLKDTKLNISDKYFKPGFAFGGPCLPKEVQGISAMAKEKSISLPIVDSILSSNNVQMKKLIGIIEKSSYKKIGIAGISFKPGTSDLRNSPLLEIIKYFSKRPTYQEPLKFLIFDPAIIQNDFENMDLQNTSLIERLEDMPKDLDLFILGPYQLQNAEIKILSSKSKCLIDLMYFDRDSNLSIPDNYKTLFDMESE